MNKPSRPHAVQWLCAAALAGAPMLSHAIDDAAGDFVAGYLGARTGDLDVRSATAVFDPANDTFTLSATMAGAIGTTPTAFYVWGVNRGNGAAAFAANGLSGVRFDTVVALRPGGNSTAGAFALAASAIAISGDTITAVVPGSNLPTTGFAEADYEWNLWPRDSAAPAGFVAISDFAPDNADFATTLAVPEPETYALMLAGLAVVGWRARRRTEL